MNEIEDWIDKLAQEHGAIHGLVCCAGIVIPSPRLHEMNMDHFRKIIDVNQYGTVNFNAVVLRHFMQQNARGDAPPKGGYTILNMGSKGSVEGLPSSPAYTASKHAVLGLTRVISKDYAADNVRCNCLCPGLIMSDMMRQLNASGKPELSAEALLKQCYTRRFGTAEEMANIVTFLMGPESSYITGQALEGELGYTSASLCFLIVSCVSADGQWSI